MRPSYNETLKIGFIQMVSNRAAATLLPLIQERIEDNSIIWSDQWVAYDGFGALPRSSSSNAWEGLP